MSPAWIKGLYAVRLLAAGALIVGLVAVAFEFDWAYALAIGSAVLLLASTGIGFLPQKRAASTPVPLDQALDQVADVGSAASRFAERFDHLLEGHGFAPVPERQEAFLAKRTYRAGERYITFLLSRFPQDGIPIADGRIGTGSDAWPEGDWNSVELWRLVGRTEPYNVEGKTLGWLLDAFQQDLEQAAPFLAGDLAEFKSIRAARAREKPSYRVVRSDGTPVPDARTLQVDELKRVYSAEDAP